MKLPRYSAVELLVALGLLFLSAPFLEDLPHGTLIEAVLLTLVMVSAVVAVGAHGKALAVTLVLLALALAGKWASHFWPDLVHPAWVLAVTVLFFGYVIAQLLAFVVRAPRVDLHVLCAGISGYLMLGLLWMPVYLTVAQLNPAAFSMPPTSGPPAVMDGFDAFYFSFITLCTVGYGDIAPVSNAARMLAVVEAIVGLFYMAVLVSRLVSVFSSTQPPAK